MNDWRKTQGEPELFGAQAKREKDRMKAAGQWPPTPPKGTRKRSPASTAAPAAAGASTSGYRPGTAPVPSGPAPTSAGAAVAAGIAARLAGVAAHAIPDPNDPVAQALGKTALLVQPSWEIDGKFLVIDAPGALQKVRLPIEAKPGPYTPTEEIHDILGQPDLMMQVAIALAESMSVLVMGPTGVAKTVVFRWFAKQLNWNLVTCQIHGGTAPEDLAGEFLPVETGSKSVAQMIKLIYGPVSKAILASQEHPTILVFEEVNRIGNMQAFAKIYSLLDDTKQLEIPMKEDAKGLSEVLVPGKLHVGANMNPADVGYIGTQVLDVALGRRFPVQYEVGYPVEEIEAEALRRRVGSGFTLEKAKQMVAMATMVRKAENITYPLSFPDMVAWAKMLPYLGWDKAAESAVVTKAEEGERAPIRNLVLLRPASSTVGQP
jgi:MoxR-like ATPase